MKQPSSLAFVEAIFGVGICFTVIKNIESRRLRALYVNKDSRPVYVIYNIIRSWHFSSSVLA